MVEGAMLAALHASAPATTVAAIIDVLRDAAVAADLPVSDVSHPGHIGPRTSGGSSANRPPLTPEAATHANSQGSPPAERRVDVPDSDEECLLRALDQWGAQLDEESWPGVLRVACAKFLSEATDVWSLKVLKRLLPAVERSPTSQALVVHAAMERLRALGPSRVEDEPAPNAPSGEESAHSPLDRLRPLLLLEMLPERGWCASPGPAGEMSHAIEAGSNDESVPIHSSLRDLIPPCRDALLKCFNDEHEMQQVRKMAASLLARLPPAAVYEMVFAHIGQLSQRPHELCNQPLYSLALYYVCCAVTLHLEAAAAVAGEAATAIFFGIFAAGVGGDAMVRVQRGAMDCLARALCVLSSTDHLEPFASRITSLLAAPTTEAIAIAIVTIATRMQHARGGNQLAAKLVQSVMPLLLGHGGSAAITQCLFDLAFHSQPHLPRSQVRQLLERAGTDLRSARETDRLAALKLLGVLFTSLDLSSPEDHAILAPCISTLRSLCAEDPSGSVRGLAQQLAQTAFGG